MREFNIKGELDQINSLQKNHKKLSEQGRKILDSICEYLKSDEIKLNPLFEAGFITFTLWGLTFKIKAETIWTKDSKGFRNGEINLYLVQKKIIQEESEVSLLTYQFDAIGNINSFYLVEEFSKFYYRDFVKNLIEYCSNNSVKMGLSI